MLIIDLPLFFADDLDDEFTAIVVDRATGAIVDTCGNFDSAENYALYEGHEYVVLAMTDWHWTDGTLRASAVEVQSALTLQTDLWADCFDAPVPHLTAH